MNELAGWFSNWEKIQDIALGALVFYVAVVVLVRLLGKRTTSQMNNFDWIITVAVGSLAASGILLSNVAILDAITAIVALALLQWVTTWLVFHSRAASRLVKAEPTLLLHRGQYLRNAMRRTRVSEEEIRAVLRSQGLSDPGDANWVILETNGEISVIPKSDATLSGAGTMCDVKAPDSLKEAASSRAS